MLTTRWVDKTENNFEEIISRILNFQENKESSFGDKNFKFEKIFSENKFVIIGDKNIIFNKINFSYDTIIEGEQPEEDRITLKKGFIIVYSTGSNTNYIISKNSDAKSFLRKINECTEKNTIVENMINYEEDFFIWLINKVYSNSNILELSDKKEIEIKSIKGFRGKTSDLLTQIKADGETVINVISTLAFLLESKNINQITIEIGYRPHENIELKINKKGTIDIDVKYYLGELIDETDEELKFVKLVLLVYLDLLPKIYQYYKGEKSNTEWSTEKYKTFIEEIKNDILLRIEAKIK